MKIYTGIPHLTVLVGMLLGLAGLLQTPSQGSERAGLLLSPHPGVLCDRYFCAGKEAGVSMALTRRYLGAAAAKTLAAQGQFDTTAFTFANGVFCDLAEKQCRANRYLDAQGHRSGEVRKTETRMLFGGLAPQK